MQNVTMRIDGNKLVIEVDLTKEIGPSLARSRSEDDVDVLSPAARMLEAQPRLTSRSATEKRQSRR